jgi:hypothetical protein
MTGHYIAPTLSNLAQHARESSICFGCRNCLIHAFTKCSDFNYFNIAVKTVMTAKCPSVPFGERPLMFIRHTLHVARVLQ